MDELLAMLCAFALGAVGMVLFIAWKVGKDVDYARDVEDKEGLPSGPTQ